MQRFAYLASDALVVVLIVLGLFLLAVSPSNAQVSPGVSYPPSVPYTAPVAAPVVAPAPADPTAPVPSSYQAADGSSGMTEEQGADLLEVSKANGQLLAQCAVAGAVACWLLVTVCVLLFVRRGT